MPLATLVRQIESDSETSEHLGRGLETIKAILLRQKPTIKPAAAALLPIFLHRWEDMIEGSQESIEIDENDFYVVINTLLRNSSSLQLVDPTVYASYECWTPSFKEDFVPRMHRHLAGEDPKKGEVEYITITDSGSLEANRAKLQAFSSWFNKFGVPYFVANSEAIDRSLARKFAKTCLFVFNGSLVVKMAAEQNWNVPSGKWTVTLLVADSQIREYVAEANRRKVRLVPSS